MAEMPGRTLMYAPASFSLHRSLPLTLSYSLTLPCLYLQGQLDVVQLLLQSGANASAADKARYTPLHWAAGKGHAKVVTVRRFACSFSLNFLSCSSADALASLLRSSLAID